MKFNLGLVVVCAGKGTRFKKDKAVLKIFKKPLFYRTLENFLRFLCFRQIVLVLCKKNFPLAKKLIKDKRVLLVEGGLRRRDSVCNGLTALGEDISHVLIHDGARPFVSKKVIQNIIKTLKKYPAVICGLPSQDTLKIVDKSFVKKTISRERVFLIQTPQGFKKALLIKAYNLYKGKATDSSQVIEAIGKKVKVIDGCPMNFKITYPKDLVLAEAILKIIEK